MPVNITKAGPSAKSATMTETVTNKTTNGPEETLKDETTMSDEPVVNDSDQPFAQVDVEVGGTIPTQQYANIRCSVRVSVPCKVDEIDDTYDVAKDWAVDRLNQLIDENLEK